MDTLPKPRDESGSLLSQADALIALGRADEAKKILASGKQRFPEQSKFYLRLAQICRLAGEHEAAFTFATDAVKKSPDGFGGYLSQADALIALGRADEARKILIAGEKRFSERAQFNLRLGDMSLAENAYESAHQFFTTAVEREPGNIRGYIGLANTLIALGEFAAAEKTVLEGKKQFPEAAELDLFLNYLSVPIDCSGFEAKVLQVWKAVLENQHLQLDDDFFQVGGDSLNAEQLLLSLEALCGRRLSHDLLIENTTPRQMAKRIDSVHELATRSIVALKKDGSRPPLIFMHGLGGTVLSYRNLTNHLHKDQPAFALSAPESIASTDFNPLNKVTINSIASEHIDRLMNLGFSEPFILCGPSFAGTIAYEVACQLANMGQLVRLVLFDVHPPSIEVAWPMRESDKSMAGRIRRNLIPAAKSYRPNEYFGEVLLILAKDQPLSWQDKLQDGWRSLIKGPLIIKKCRGSHSTLFATGNTPALSQDLEETLLYWQAAIKSPAAIPISVGG